LKVSPEQKKVRGERQDDQRNKNTAKANEWWKRTAREVPGQRRQIIEALKSWNTLRPSFSMEVETDGEIRLFVDDRFLEFSIGDGQEFLSWLREICAPVLRDYGGSLGDSKRAIMNAIQKSPDVDAQELRLLEDIMGEIAELYDEVLRIERAMLAFVINFNTTIRNLNQPAYMPSEVSDTDFQRNAKDHRSIQNFVGVGNGERAVKLFPGFADTDFHDFGPPKPAEKFWEEWEKIFRTARTERDKQEKAMQEQSPTLNDLSSTSDQAGGT
ncbi:hypothetical protein OAG01_01650, partial [bacterium]|nr:hypothetical protein [bacterium]